jgi:hypothetical protein
MVAAKKTLDRKQMSAGDEKKIGDERRKRYPAGGDSKKSVLPKLLVASNE